LYDTIVAHRKHFNAVTGINYDNHHPTSINILPVDSVLSAWQADYATMIEEMIYEEKPPSFNELLEILKSLQQRVNMIRKTS
jgi:hypothetical protein